MSPLTRMIEQERRGAIFTILALLVLLVLLLLQLLDLGLNGDLVRERREAARQLRAHARLERIEADRAQERVTDGKLDLAEDRELGLEAHPAVKAAAAFAIPSAVHGGIPAAAVELHASAEVSVEDLMARARARLSTSR